MFIVTNVKKTVEIKDGQAVPSYQLEAHIETDARSLGKILRQRAEGDHRVQQLRAFALGVTPDGTPSILAEVGNEEELRRVADDPMNRLR